MGQYGGTSARPPLVTAAGVLLIVSGGLSILLSLFLLGGGGLFLLYVLIGLAVGGLTIFAGLQVLQLRMQGRSLGIALAAIGGIFALVSLIRGNVFSIVGLAIDAFVIYALVTSESSFR
jgi:hypothetical protein